MTINKDNKIKKVKSDDLENYLSEGWEMGRNSGYTTSMRGRVMINNGKSQIYLEPEEVIDFLNSNHEWKIGSGKLGWNTFEVKSSIAKYCKENRIGGFSDESIKKRTETQRSLRNGLFDPKNQEKIKKTNHQIIVSNGALS